MTITPHETIAAAAAVVAVMIVLDVLAGLLSAASRGDIDSSTLRHGLLHKLALVVAFALALVLEYAESILDIGACVPLVVPVATYITVMEACSVYENLRRVNPDLHIKSFEDLFRFTTESRIDEFKARLDEDISEEGDQNE